MKVPIATYRVQLNKEFTFHNLKGIMPYLSDLGISHIYASPIFRAKPGSMHGYDIVDFNVISDELGGQNVFEDLISTVAACGLDWIQDIVPNHAAYSLDNKMVYDLMEKGFDSKYHDFLDVDWNYPSNELRGKLVVPFLEKHYVDCLKQGQLSLIFNDNLKIKYKGLEFPINIQSTKKLMKNTSIEHVIKLYNSDPALLDDLLSAQFYALTQWKLALKQINYRRFFDIIDLIGLRIENENAFEAIHRLIFQLLSSKKISGLRIDHVDGLFNPEVYLTKLREMMPDNYLIVEKILTDKENLSSSWPVQGTTGYEFVNFVNKIFIQQTKEWEIEKAYHDFTGTSQAFTDLLYDCKRYIVKNYFLGEVQNLARLIFAALTKLQYKEAPSRYGLKQVVIELLACFPVYRSYVNEKSTCRTAPFRLAVKLAKQRASELNQELAAIEFLLKESKAHDEALHAIMRFQQFTGAIMAKGFEDTALYRYNRFLSLNEVGSNPSQFGCNLKDFHEFNRFRQKKWVFSINATSTHDTKRGEDVRARLNVLSEIPEQLKAAVDNWSELNINKKKVVSGKLAPDRNEEYYLYQILLGALPWNLNDLQEFSNRIKMHMVKVLREAKTTSNWLSPNLQYEEAVTGFVDEIISSQHFLDAFLPLQKKVAYYGLFNSLAQTLLKVTCPGIPDFYQGSELWDLNLVDPDNRRLVDFQRREKALEEILKLDPSRVQTLLKNPEIGKAKLYVIYKALKIRRKFRLLFEEGAYLPLTVKGSLSDHVVAFCRYKNDIKVIVVVPRFLTGLLKSQAVWDKADIDWADTSISLPEWKVSSLTDVFTNKTIFVNSKKLLVRDILGLFPLALLYSGELHA